MIPWSILTVLTCILFIFSWVLVIRSLQCRLARAVGVPEGSTENNDLLFVVAGGLCVFRNRRGLVFTTQSGAAAGVKIFRSSRVSSSSVVVSSVAPSAGHEVFVCGCTSTTPERKQTNLFCEGFRRLTYFTVNICVLF